jgi:hypothetical protein
MSNADFGFCFSSFSFFLAFGAMVLAVKLNGGINKPSPFSELSLPLPTPRWECLLRREARSAAWNCESSDTTGNPCVRLRASYTKAFRKVNKITLDFDVAKREAGNRGAGVETHRRRLVGFEGESLKIDTFRRSLRWFSKYSSVNSVFVNSRFVFINSLFVFVNFGCDFNQHFSLRSL